MLSIQLGGQIIYQVDAARLALLCHQLALRQLQAANNELLLAPGQCFRRRAAVYRHLDISSLGAYMGIPLLDIRRGGALEGIAIVQLAIPALLVAQLQVR